MFIIRKRRGLFCWLQHFLVETAIYHDEWFFLLAGHTLCPAQPVDSIVTCVLCNFCVCPSVHPTVYVQNHVVAKVTTKMAELIFTRKLAVFCNFVAICICRL